MPSYPTYLAHSNQAFEVPLLKFSKEALEVFLQIERPGEHDGLPEDDEFETIGQFYEAIEEALKRLSGELGEEALFSGDPARQVTDELYYGGSGRIITVTDLASAIAALEEIVEQGEGMQHQEIWDGDRDMFHPDREEVAHYFRFNEIVVGRRYQAGDTPQSGPDRRGVRGRLGRGPRHAPEPSLERLPGGKRGAGGARRLQSHVLELPPPAARVLQRQPAAPRRCHRPHVRAQGGGRPADGAAVGRRQDDRGNELRVRAAGERHLSGSVEPKIVVIRNGPYLVYGNVPLVRKKKLVSELNDAIAWQKTEVIETEDTYALCRCGQSSTKPFCDGSHTRDFDGTETADTRPTSERIRIVPGSIYAEEGGETVLEGAGIVVKRDGYLCMHAAFCVGRIERVPAMMEGACRQRRPRPDHRHDRPLPVRVVHVLADPGRPRHRGRPAGRRSR